MTTKIHRHGTGLLLLASMLVSAGRAAADEVSLKLISSGAMQKLGYYMPRRLELSESKPEGLKKAPEGLEAPLYGQLKLGPVESPTTFLVIVDEPEGKPARLFVDANANGDLTDDPAPDWKGKTEKTEEGKQLTMYSGGTTLKISYGAESLELHVPMYRFDKNDPRRAELKHSLFYYRDYARSGEVTLGGKSYAAMLVDEGATADFRGGSEHTAPPGVLLLDLNGDGKFDSRRESFQVNQPFNIGGTTYEIAGLGASGSPFQIVKSSKTVEETKPAPSLSAGHKALSFEAKTTAGDAVKFPADYKGKLVLLDFWATWCGPCRAELPHLTAAYEKFHKQGLDVLGISLDRENQDSSLAQFTKENKMLWPQVYDGKFWKAEVAQKYFIDSIPHAFLVDGDSGMIVAEGQALRGEQLTDTLDKELSKKGK